MTTSSIIIENLKCGGCANSIKKGLLSIENVQEVDIDLDTSEVKVKMSQDILSLVKEKLSKLGYPEMGDKNTVLHKAKSYVSCAVGRMDS